LPLGRIPSPKLPLFRPISPTLFLPPTALITEICSRLQLAYRDVDGSPADIAGIRALAVHVKDPVARDFYQKFDFIPSLTDPMHRFVLLKDVRRIISG